MVGGLMRHCLYKSMCRVTGKYYIGVHGTKDVGFGTPHWRDSYVGSGKALRRALNKYGREAFLVEVITEFATKQEAYAAERSMVTEQWLETNKGKVYNMTPGGKIPPKSDGWFKPGQVFTAEHRQRLREAKLGRKQPWTHSLPSQDTQRRINADRQRGKSWKIIDGRRVWVNADGSPIFKV